MDDRLLAERYGTERDPRRRRRGITLAVAAFVIALVAYVVFAVASAREVGVTVEHVGYEVSGPDLAHVTFNVSAPEGARLTCVLTAVSEQFTQVGFVEVPVGPVDEGRIAVTADVPTVEPAASATVEGCDPVE